MRSYEGVIIPATQATTKLEIFIKIIILLTDCHTCLYVSYNISYENIAVHQDIMHKINERLGEMRC